MEGTTPARCYKLAARAAAKTVAQHGDVDINGDLVDRLRRAVGDCVGFDRETHVAGVAGEVMRVQAARGLA